MNVLFFFLRIGTNTLTYVNGNNKIYVHISTILFHFGTHMYSCWSNVQKPLDYSLYFCNIYKKIHTSSFEIAINGMSLTSIYTLPHLACVKTSALTEKLLESARYEISGTNGGLVATRASATLLWGGVEPLADASTLFVSPLRFLGASMCSFHSIDCVGDPEF